MFITRRFLQIGLAASLLGGCASPAPKPEASAAPPATTEGKPQVIRIGSDTPAAEPSATLTPGGKMRPEVRSFAEALASERALPLESVLGMLTDSRYSSTVARLIAPSVPGRKVWRSWLTYRSRFVEPKRIAWGVSFWNEHRAVIERAAQQYGVPASIIVSIIGVETLYGRNMGNFRVIDALATLAFDYPEPVKPERVEMFRTQLADFITLTLQGKLEPGALGSFAGAVGMPQFMPTSIAHYAVDGDDDGHIDLANSVPDAVMSVGNFLQKHGWQRGLPVFAPVTLPADPSALVDGGLTPRLDWARLQQAGARLPAEGGAGSWQSSPLGIVDLAEEARGTVQYRTGTANFFVITQYNRSYFYATAVADLAAELQARVGRP
ncbi:lytic murein transglycosylase B [Bordetella pseudohinzii]|uniref:Lytic murein transglycosylase B n=1 Tax=Bordetella pseudohinzii TaxID=1331258 RepID=A0A0J6F3M1_9BORD|nr:lytic murein transglycosylase B [Bordetella pseudohinzii]ANY15616.1 lytic murein transglycosylase B [Bordetella pseudohinzii]KMM27065.1 murein transglycosylase [Bordetella pseudohinzii]KXA82335.1 murein transglycosylase [Bordetella pseudohinzii]KXA82741.1 murein transglycosylase [Bordetella pseudohinzii]CUI56051.1 Membrane-bound lytic murein transglycosylase B precursor [Bordetella pseudohinzii]